MPGIVVSYVTTLLQHPTSGTMTVNGMTTSRCALSSTRRRSALCGVLLPGVTIGYRTHAHSPDTTGGSDGLMGAVCSVATFIRTVWNQHWAVRHRSSRPLTCLVAPWPSRWRSSPVFAPTHLPGGALPPHACPVVCCPSALVC